MTASEDAAPDRPDATSVSPQHHSLMVEVLRRPLESAQYTSLAFGRRLREAGLVASMGTVGDALDNAVAESFFATLECELLHRHRFRTRTEARLAVFDWLEGLDNPTGATPPSVSSAPPTPKGATSPPPLQHSPNPSTKPGQLHGDARDEVSVHGCGVRGARAGRGPTTMRTTASSSRGSWRNT